MKKILFFAAPIFLLALIAFHPVATFTVSGTISGEDGKPISFASIRLKGSTTGVSSDYQGAYHITIPAGQGTLMFTAAGYVPVNEKVNGRTLINVTLHKDKAALNEVVLTEMDKKLDRANNQPLKGRTPGLAVTTAYGVRRTAGEDEDDIDYNREGYDAIVENRFLKTNDNPLSTFSIDVDAASYSNVRRFLNNGQLPPAGAVRIEEMVNYFHYDYDQPKDDKPFAVMSEVSDAPWNHQHKLVLIGLQGKSISTEKLPPSNITFLIDVSGSMMEPNKLPLVKASMKMLVDQLRSQDRISMVVYAGAAGLVLPPTSGAEKIKIKDAIDKLEAGGSTAGGAGIMLAYRTAEQNFIKGGNNRVILCTDGDFNVGESSDDAMERLIEQERTTGVYLTVLGFGMGNYQDAKMQKLADKGNGNHAYIDGLAEARKVLVSEFGGTLFTIAKDVKLQVEFNPARVQGYRLIGYENRMLAKEDFNDDKKDAGDMGSGHTVTALYEIIPVGVNDTFLNAASVDKLKYQKNVEPFSHSNYSNEWMTVKLRYKAPDGDVSRLFEHTVTDSPGNITTTSDNFRFAASVAEFGMLLRNSPFCQHSTFQNVLELAKNARGRDEEGYRAEFIRLVQGARSIAKTSPATEDDNELGSK